jgi:SNF2 family DNA or RNA helicase
MCGTNINIEDIDAASASETKYLCQHSVCSTCASRSEDINAREESLCPKCCKKGTAILKPAIVPNCMDAAIILPSSKVEALLKNLRAEQANSWASHESRPAKRYISSSSQNPPLPVSQLNQFSSVVFSYWTKMLDLVQTALQAAGFVFQRVDGHTSLDNRTKAIAEFTYNPRCTIMLASISAAGEG